jgi:hypothetical protein
MAIAMEQNVFPKRNEFVNLLIEMTNGFIPKLPQNISNPFSLISSEV